MGNVNIYKRKPLVPMRVRKIYGKMVELKKLQKMSNYKNQYPDQFQIPITDSP
jgi:hypothetical protein